MCQKGELSPADIDRGWPYQMVLSARACEGNGYNEIHEFCKDLSLCDRGHGVCDKDEWFNVYCFQQPGFHRNRGQWDGRSRMNTGLCVLKMRKYAHSKRRAVMADDEAADRRA